MTIRFVKKAVVVSTAAYAVLFMAVSFLVVSCTNTPPAAPSPSPAAKAEAPAPAPGGCFSAMSIDPKSATPPWVPPADIPGGAQSASLQAAAVFAWQEFIALNWPAVQQTGKLNTRDTPDPNAIFGDPKYSGAQPAGPLVWHTFRHKAEIFPGTGNPNGYSPDPAQSYGYDSAPQYIYQNGPIPSASQSPTPLPPWINLDEQSEIGLDAMFAGNAPTAPFPGQQILFMAKANRNEYNYIAANHWWDGNTVGPAMTATANYIASFNNGNGPTPISQYAEPAPGSTTQPAPANSLVSFPNNTIEVKTGWRQLTTDEINSGRFYTAPVRFYNQTGGPNGPIGYVDAVWGMVALHIIQKTQSAPYFIYATFSQADNLLDANGKPVEDADGNLIQNQNATPLDPDISSKNATSANPANANSVQVLTAAPSASPSPSPDARIFYTNEPSTALPKGHIALNRREHNIPQCVIDVNRAAHEGIREYGKLNNNPNPVWQYYKLVNVQYKPYDKPAGQTYTGAPGGPDPSTYYQANEVVESDYNLQVFSGQFQNTPSPTPSPNVNVFKLITDYNNDGSPFRNVYYSPSAQPGGGTASNMGGCMGCHANAQVKGADFSFILLFSPVGLPEVATGPSTPSPQGVKKFSKLLLRNPTSNPTPTPK